MRTSPFGKDN